MSETNRNLKSSGENEYRFAPPSEKVQIDVRLDEVVLRSLEKEPEKRYQNVSDIKTEVESICGTFRLHPTTAKPYVESGKLDPESIQLGVRGVADALFFPLLVLDTLIVWGVFLFIALCLNVLESTTGTIVHDPTISVSLSI